MADIILFWKYYVILIFVSSPPCTAGPCGVATLSGSTDGWADGTGTNAKLHGVLGMSMSFDNSFALFGDDTGRIRKYVLSTNTVSTLVGDGIKSSTDGVGTNARVVHVVGVDISFNDSFTLLIDQGGHKIRKLILSTLMTSTIAGSGVAGDFSGEGAVAQFDGPSGVVLSDDDFYAVISNSNQHTIRKVVISTGVVSLLAGSAGIRGLQDGSGTNAQFNIPAGLAISSDHSYVVVADRDNHVIRKLVLATNTVTTVAGCAQGSQNGVGSIASFNQPAGVSMHPNGLSVFVGELGSGSIRRVYFSSVVKVTTVVGSIRLGYVDGSLGVAKLNRPVAIAIHPVGSSLLTIPYMNDKIRHVVYDECTEPAQASTKNDSVLVIMFLVMLWIVTALVALCTLTDSSTVPANSIQYNTAATEASSKKKGIKKKKKNMSQHKATLTAGPAVISSVAMHKALMKYVDRIVPAVFQPRRAVWASMRTEVTSHHRYLKTLLKRDTNHLLAAMHLLTVFSMCFFLLSVLFDVQFPDQNEQCEHLASEKACLLEKTFFDKGASICRWIVRTQSPIEYCEYQPARLSVRGFIAMIIIVGAATAPINMIVDFMFDRVLGASTVDEQHINRRIPPATRPLKVHPLSSATTALQTVATSGGAERGWFVRIKEDLLYSDVTAFNLPIDVLAAHNTCCGAVMSISKSLEKAVAVGSEWRGRILCQTGVLQTLDPSAPIFKNSSLAVSNAAAGYEAPHESIVDFIFNLHQQRSVFIRDHARREIFDQNWGIVAATGAFRDVAVVDTKRHCPRLRSCPVETMEKALERELAEVTAASSDHLLYIRTASKVQKGVECLQLFIIDLLGRKTPAAKIYKYKMEEEFGRVWIVTKRAQHVAWTIVFLLNAVFIGLVIVSSVHREPAWQHAFVVLCVLQMAIEMCVFSTIECLCIHHHIPRLVRLDVEQAVRTLYASIDFAVTNDVLTNLKLNVPTYLFVSTQVAKQFPHLFECSIVNAYQSCLGGQLVQHLRDKTVSLYDARQHRSWLSRVCLSGMSAFSVWKLLLFVGTFPFELQRLFVHMVQPFVLAAVLVVGNHFEQYPMLILIPIGVIIYECFRLSTADAWRSKEISASADEDLLRSRNECSYDVANSMSLKNRIMSRANSRAPSRRRLVSTRTVRRRRAGSGLKTTGSTLASTGNSVLPRVMDDRDLEALTTIVNERRWASGLASFGGGPSSYNGNGAYGSGTVESGELAHGRDGSAKSGYLPVEADDIIRPPAIERESVVNGRGGVEGTPLAIVDAAGSLGADVPECSLVDPSRSGQVNHTAATRMRRLLARKLFSLESFAQETKHSESLSEGSGSDSDEELDHPDEELHSRPPYRGMYSLADSDDSNEDDDDDDDDGVDEEPSVRRLVVNRFSRLFSRDKAVTDTPSEPGAVSSVVSAGAAAMEGQVDSDELNSMEAGKGNRVISHSNSLSADYSSAHSNLPEVIVPPSGGGGSMPHCINSAPASGSGRGGLGGPLAGVGREELREPVEAAAIHSGGPE